MNGKSRGAARPASADRRQAGGGTRQGCGRGMSDPSGALFNFLKRVCAHRRQSAQLLYGEGTAVRQHLVAPRFQHLSQFNQFRLFHTRFCLKNKIIVNYWLKYCTHACNMGLYFL